MARARSRSDPRRLEGSANFAAACRASSVRCLSGTVEAGDRRSNVLGTPLPLQNVVRDALLIALALVVARDHAEGDPHPQRIPLGADRRSGQDLRGDLRHDHSGARDPRRRPARRAGLAGRSSWRRPDGTPRQHRVVLGHGRAVGVSRQRADVPRVLQPRRRRCAGADGPARARRSRRSRWQPSTSAHSLTSATRRTS